MTPAKRKRIGCGCLGCVVPLLGFVGIGMVLIVLFHALVAPWAFFLGGTFHPIPAWAGTGRFHTRAGDFALILDLEPSSSRLGYPRVTGNATLFTPRGEHISLRINGMLLEKAIGFEPDGQTMTLEFHHRAPWAGIVSADTRPHFVLRGVWRGRDFDAVDQGSITRAFLPDGRVDRGPGRPAPPASASIRVVLRTGSWPEYLRVAFGDEPDTTSH